VLIDLEDLVKRVYDLGRYSRTLRRGQPLPQPLGDLLGPEEREWIESVGGGG
jgi:hypothetical protein